MLMLGWGLAAVLGALAGVLVAPRLFLDPNMMASVLIYSFSGAALGGFDSPIGAVVGSLLIGVLENLAGRYVDFIGPELKVLVPLAIIFAVLLVRPAGLFGSPEVSRA
jgi:branched-chain amino acid transport system permease protein